MLLVAFLFCIVNYEWFVSREYADAFINEELNVCECFERIHMQRHIHSAADLMAIVSVILILWYLVASLCCARKSNERAAAEEIMTAKYELKVVMKKTPFLQLQGGESTGGAVPISIRARCTIHRRGKGI